MVKFNELKARVDQLSQICKDRNLTIVTAHQASRPNPTTKSYVATWEHRPFFIDYVNRLRPIEHSGGAQL